MSSRNNSTSTSKSQKKKLSFYTRARQSFARSGGSRGAGVKQLRGTTGSDFEGLALVLRGGVVETGCCCFGSSNGGEKFLLIKGAFCFVFRNPETSSAPLYAISLHGLNAVLVDSNNYVVHLRNPLGDVAYELQFDKARMAKTFCNVVQVNAAVAHDDQVKERLGHAHLIKKRQSIRFAESIALDKEREQPSMPLTTGEILGNLPQPAF